MNDYMTSVELCRCLDISAPTLRRWVATGRLPRPLCLRKNFHVWPAEQVRPLIDRLAQPQPIPA